MTRIALYAAAAVAALAATPAVATDYYAGKTIELIVGSDAGGPFDIYGRMIAKYMVKYIPGTPTILPKNMPGAAANKAAAYVYSQGAKDGTVIGVITPGVVAGPLTDANLMAQFDPTKFFYLGSADSAARVCVTYQTSKIKTFDDARKNKVIVGATADGGASKDYPTMLNAVAGAKFEIVSGYKGVAEYILAMERGEVDGACTGWSVFPSTKPDWIRDKKLNILLQMGPESDPYFDKMGVPEVWGYLNNPDDRKMIELMVSQQLFQRPYILPPGTPAEAVKILRTAFDSVVKDPDFLAEAAKAKLTVNSASGEKVQKLVESVYATPKPLVERYKKTMETGK
jgi:tripartite-type tricarboxylate transporter receptor subunit TctC